MAREINAAQYQAEVIGSPVSVLLDIYGEYCPPCHQLAPTIDKLAAHYEGRAKVGSAWASTPTTPTKL